MFPRSSYSVQIWYIADISTLRYRDGVIPRDLLCPVCKDEIEDETFVLFSCKAYDEFRRDVRWFDGLHTAAVTDVSNVMSADDEMSIRELSSVLFRTLQRRNDVVTLQSST